MVDAWVLERWFEPILSQVKPHTMTSLPRLYNLTKAVDHICGNRIAGDLVECGVWRGGSLMAMALRLMQRKETDRRLFAFDTFEGMSPAGKDDIILSTGQHFNDLMRRASTEVQQLYAARAGLDLVRNNMASTNYPADRVTYVKGNVLETLPGQAPEKIALLRLDTDFYDSTWHELVTLYPRLVSGGLLFIDDYGHFKGARDATDKFWATLDKKPMLWAVDYTCRVAVKP